MLQTKQQQQKGGEGDGKKRRKKNRWKEMLLLTINVASPSWAEKTNSTLETMASVVCSVRGR